MAIAWHAKRWWNFCMIEDDKKEIEPTFAEQCFWSIKYGSIGIFCLLKSSVNI